MKSVSMSSSLTIQTTKILRFHSTSIGEDLKILHGNVWKYISHVFNNVYYSIVSQLFNFNFLLCLIYKVSFNRGLEKNRLWHNLPLLGIHWGSCSISEGNKGPLTALSKTPWYLSFGPMIPLLRTYDKDKALTLTNIHKAFHWSPAHSRVLFDLQLNLHQQKETSPHYNASAED